MCFDKSHENLCFDQCLTSNSAGGHLSGGEGVASVSKYRATLSIYALEEIKQGEEVCISYLILAFRHQRHKWSWWPFVSVGPCFRATP